MLTSSKLQEVLNKALFKSAQENGISPQDIRFKICIAPEEAVKLERNYSNQQYTLMRKTDIVDELSLKSVIGKKIALMYGKEIKKKIGGWIEALAEQNGSHPIDADLRLALQPNKESETGTEAVIYFFDQNKHVGHVPMDSLVK